MEENRRHRQSSLKVERNFTGSRLETQIVARTYELAAPILRKNTDVVPSTEPVDLTRSDSFSSPCVAKGA